MDKFSVLYENNNELYILHKGNIITILYIHTLQYIIGKTYSECDKYNLFIEDREELTTIGEKLKFYRLKNSIFQSDLAEMVGIDRVTYIEYEKGLKYYPYETMKKIAKVYNIPLFEILDDYHMFAYSDQAKIIKGIRIKLGMNQYEFAKAIDVSKSTIQKAESNMGGFSQKSYRKFNILKIRNYRKGEFK